MTADVCVLHDAGFGEAETARIKTKLMGSPPVDGVFALGDMIAAGYVHMVLLDAALYRQHLPLVGFDGLDIARLFEISTVAQPIREMGERAVELLIRRINGETVPEKLMLPVAYIERRSTQPRQP
jgi:LacI family sucrose operon transcriptional repressor